MSGAPNIVVFSGPNGAGKSTTAPNVLRRVFNIDEFVNADVIAQGLSAFAPETVAFQAGRIMLERLRSLAHERKSFAFETTLASRTFAPWIRRLVASGYTFDLLFFYLESPELAESRVKTRVETGGHDVPPEIIERRYHRGLRNFFELYQSLATNWRFFDNSAASVPRLLAMGKGITCIDVNDKPLWDRIRGRYEHG